MSVPPLAMPLGRYLRRRGIPPLPLTVVWLHGLAAALDAGASAPNGPGDLLVVPTPGRWELRLPAVPAPGEADPAAAFVATARALLSGRIAGPGSLESRLPPSELRPGLPPAVDGALREPRVSCRARAARLGLLLSHVACPNDIRE
ncbi:MAG: hypothetical protein AB7L13_02290 [Acidimicrobiia bacterium]